MPSNGIDATERLNASCLSFPLPYIHFRDSRKKRRRRNPERHLVRFSLDRTSHHLQRPEHLERLDRFLSSDFSTDGTMDYSAFYPRNAKAFLSARNLSFDDLGAVAHRQYEDAEHTLLTSSAVHGIANSTSDIDLICITGANQSHESMASQVYHQGHHMEVVAFANHEVISACRELVSQRSKPPTDVLNAYRQWDKSQRISRKYLERIITGVATDGGLPYLDWQEPLGAMWSVASFDAFRQSIGFASLSLRCGQAKGAAGYATNGLLYLMNAMLSRAGWTVSNKKWTLLRWRQAMDSLCLWDDIELAGRIDGLWPATYRSCVTGLTSSSMEQLVELVDLAECYFGYQMDYAARYPISHSANSVPFLPRSAFMLRSDGRAALIPTADPVAGITTHPRDLLATTPDMARHLLTSARAGVLDFSLTDFQS